MKRRDEVAAVEFGRKLLGDAGDRATERYDWGARGVHVVHVRRVVTEAEEAQLPAWFMACTAIDHAGMQPLVL